MSFVNIFPLKLYYFYQFCALFNLSLSNLSGRKWDVFRKVFVIMCLIFGKKLRYFDVFVFKMIQTQVNFDLFTHIFSLVKSLENIPISFKIMFLL